MGYNIDGNDDDDENDNNNSNNVEEEEQRIKQLGEQIESRQSLLLIARCTALIRIRVGVFILVLYTYEALCGFCHGEG